MAIYHLTAKTGSKAKGQSAEAKSCYLQREGKYAKGKAELIYAQSGNMPSWAIEDPRAFWKSADKHERANGRLFKEIEFALPKELSLKARQKLAIRFSEKVVGLGLPYTLAIHAGKGSNPHCHLMISERINDGIERPPEQFFKRYNGKSPNRGGAQKTDSLKPKEWLEEIRADWADMANQALKKAGQKSRIDHRTLKAQGIDRIPTIHLGPNIVEMEAKGIRTDRANQVLTVERQEHERDRQNQISTEQRRVSRGSRANSRGFSADNRTDLTPTRETSGAFKRFWRRFRAYRGVKGVGGVERPPRKLYRAVSRLSSVSSGGGNSSSVLSDLNRLFSERRRNREIEQRAREFEAKVQASRDQGRGLERLHREVGQYQSRGKEDRRKNSGLQIKPKKDKSRDWGMGM
jgi:hypothetical protein